MVTRRSSYSRTGTKRKITTLTISSSVQNRRRKARPRWTLLRTFPSESDAQTPPMWRGSFYSSQAFPALEFSGYGVGDYLPWQTGRAGLGLKFAVAECPTLANAELGKHADDALRHL